MTDACNWPDDQPMPMWVLLIPWLRGQMCEPADANQCRIAADTIEAMAERIEQRDAEIARLRKACTSVLEIIDMFGRGNAVVFGKPVIREIEEAMKRP